VVTRYGRVFKALRWILVAVGVAVVLYAIGFLVFALGSEEQGPP
jgi:hypothetical protein